LQRVEVDRREQLGRAVAAAERRVERRQGLGIGGQLKEKLLTQARALRERIGQQLGRVKEWLAERFPEPMQRLKDLGRELTSGRERAAVPLDLEQVKARGRQASDQWRKDLHRQQAAQKQAAIEQREREQVVKEFKELATRRAMQMSGYRDRSEEWLATPEKLRKTIDQFNALASAAQARALERMAQKPAIVRDLRQGIEQRRVQVQQLDHGLGL
jgi:hypothetical protein